MLSLFKLLETKDTAVQGYKALSGLLKRGGESTETTHRDISNPEVLSRLVEFISRALGPDGDGDEPMRQECLRSLGYCLHTPDIAALLTPAQCGAVVDGLCRTISAPASQSSKVTCNLAVWCVSIQALPQGRLTVEIAQAVCGVLEESRYGSESLECEALTALNRLLGKLRDAMASRCASWGPLIYRRLLSPKPRVRERAAQVAASVLQLFVPVPEQLSRVVLSDLGAELLDAFDAFVRSAHPGNELFAVKVWGYFAGLLGSLLLRGRPETQRFVKIAETTFTHAMPAVRAACFESWTFVVQQLAREIASGGQSLKRLPLVVAPFINLVSRGETDAAVMDTGFTAWQSLLSALGPRLLDAFDSAVAPFLVKLLEIPDLPQTLLPRAALVVSRLLSASSPGVPPAQDKLPNLPERKIAVEWLAQRSQLFLKLIGDLMSRLPADQGESIKGCAAAFLGLVLRAGQPPLDHERERHAQLVAALVGHLVNMILGVPSIEGPKAPILRECCLTVVDGILTLLSPRNVASQYSFEIGLSARLSGIGHLSSAWIESVLGWCSDDDSASKFAATFERLAATALQTGDSFRCTALLLGFVKDHTLPKEGRPKLAEDRAKRLSAVSQQLWKALAMHLKASVESSTEPVGSTLDKAATEEVVVRTLLLPFESICPWDSVEQPSSEIAVLWSQVTTTFVHFLTLKVGEHDDFIGALASELAKTLKAAEGRTCSSAMFFLAATTLQSFTSLIDWEHASFTADSGQDPTPSKTRQRVVQKRGAGAAIEYAAAMLGLAHKEASKASVGSMSEVSSVLRAMAFMFGGMRAPPAVLRLAIRTLSEPLQTWLKEPKPVGSRLSVSLDEGVVGIKNTAFDMWDAFCANLRRAAAGDGVPAIELTTDILRDLDEVLTTGLTSKHRRFKGATLELWNATFGSIPESSGKQFRYPTSLASALRDLRGVTSIKLPFWQDGAGAVKPGQGVKRPLPPDATLLEESTAIDEELQPDANALKPPQPIAHPIVHFHEPPAKIAAGSVQGKPVAAGAKPPGTEASQYARIEDEGRQEEAIVTDRQREKMEKRSNLPKTYTALDPPSLPEIPLQQQLSSPGAPSTPSSHGATAMLASPAAPRDVASAWMSISESLLRDLEGTTTLTRDQVASVARMCNKISQSVIGRLL